ncbi:MAG: hypothetical protein CMF31_09100 [Kordiimonas sp.]|nr:hypothetical protein [Kordiimonas sp.]
MSKAAVKIRFYRLSNRLKEKVGGLAPAGDAPPAISQALLMQAQEALDDMAEDYPDWVMSLIDELAEIHRRCVDTPEQRKAHFERINKIAHDMKGQGGTFGYELITDFGDSLYDFTGPRGGKSDNHVEIIKAHIDAMRVVIKDRVHGDGGETGRLIKMGLEKAIEKYRAQDKDEAAAEE